MKKTNDQAENGPRMRRKHTQKATTVCFEMKVAISITNSIYSENVCVSVCVNLLRTSKRKRAKKERAKKKRKKTNITHEERATKNEPMMLRAKSCKR